MLIVSGCSGQHLSLSTPEPAAVEMPGRWILSAPNAPSCGLNFGGAPGAQNGNVMPEGGCPGRFFMSRRWTLKQNALAIDDQENNRLAQLTFADGRFAGQSADGLPVTLSHGPPIQ